MKVAVVHSFYSSSQSGENQAVLDQLEALRAIGCDVELFENKTTQPRSGRNFAARSAVAVASGHGPSPLRKIERFQPDVIHVHNLFPGWGDKWLKMLTAPVVLTVHNFRAMCAAGTLSREGKTCDLCPSRGSHHAVIHGCYQGSPLKTLPLAIATRKRIAPRFYFASKVIFLSGTSKKLHQTRMGAAIAEKSQVLPNFIPDDFLIEPKVSPRATPFWMFAGRLAPEKGILELIDSWPKGENLMVAGDGPLLQEAKDRSEGKPVTFTGGIPRSDVRRMMSRATGLVFPSVCMENSPLVLLEAMSLGLPILAKSGSVGADLVSEWGAGIVYESNSNLVPKLKEVAEQRMALGVSGKRAFQAKFTERRWTEQITEIYEDVCEF